MLKIMPSLACKFQGVSNSIIHPASLLGKENPTALKGKYLRKNPF
jgi:hypothetical protein